MLTAWRGGCVKNGQRISLPFSNFSPISNLIAVFFLTHLLLPLLFNLRLLWFMGDIGKETWRWSFEKPFSSLILTFRFQLFYLQFQVFRLLKEQYVVSYRMDSVFYVIFFITSDTEDLRILLSLISPVIFNINITPWYV